MCDGGENGCYVMKSAIQPCCFKQSSCNCVKSCFYNQPQRVTSFKPVSNYCQPTEKMDCSTIYNKSFFVVGDSNSRPKPILPSNNLYMTNVPHDMNTIQKLSFQNYCNIPRRQPIIPTSNKLATRGPQYSITTQKHDYVPKSVSRTQPILPSTNIDKTFGPLEKFTINKLSFMPIDVTKFPRPKPIKPMENWARATEPLEDMSIQKLSYMPVPLSSNEDLTWKHQARLPQPSYPKTQGSTYSFSYLPNSNVRKREPFLPNQSTRIFDEDNISKPSCTVYNLSYMMNKAPRSQPIKPLSNLLVEQGPTERCTVYKLSYQPNISKRTLPILPVGNQLRSNEPMSKITTHKHDFTVKPYSKPCSIIRSQNIPRLAGETEQCTVNRLSYLPIDISKNRRPKPLKPIENPKCLPPLSSFTTYKLSYMPQNITPKETYSWQLKPKYRKPLLPVESLTIQKLSYMPPGRFGKTNCSCSCECKTESTNFPTAQIC